MLMAVELCCNCNYQFPCNNKEKNGLGQSINMSTYKEQNGPSKKYLDLCAHHQKKEAEAATFIIQKLHQTS